MRYYTGLDVSMNETSICIVNQDGKITYEESAPTDPRSISHMLKQTGLKIEKVAVESGSLSNWLVKELVRSGLPIICIDAWKMSKILALNINKTDKNDARLIAEALRCGFYSEVHQKSQDLVELNMLMGARRTLKDTSTKLKNTIRGHLKAFGIRLGVVSTKRFVPAVTEAIRDKSEDVKNALHPLLSSFVSVNSQLCDMEKHIEAIARGDEDIQLLCTILGVGIITALSFKAAIGDATRFGRSRSVGAFLGLTPTQYASGETQHSGRVSKRGPSEVRYLLVEAATVLLYRTKKWSKLKAWGLKLKKRRGHKKAVVAVARKLAITMHRMLINRKPYDPGNFTEKEIEKLAARLAC